MDADKQCEGVKFRPLSKNEEEIVQQYVKYADKFIKYTFRTEKINSLGIAKKSDKLALIAINNRLAFDVKEIFFYLSKTIMKKIEYDDPLYSIIMELNSLNFTGVKMGGNPKKHRSRIFRNCNALNEAHQNLARFILTPNCLHIKKELMDTLQDIISALDRVDVRIDSQQKCDMWDSWWKFFVKEHKTVISYLYRQRNGDQQILLEAARDAICMSRSLINFLQKVVRTFNGEHQIVLEKMVNSSNEVLINLELNLRNPNLDVRELIRESMMTNSVCTVGPLKYYLFENTVTDQHEAENLKLLVHYVATSNIVICRRFIRRIML